MMAAYVVGRQGTTREVVAIGLTVAVTHTGGVLALGTIIWLSQAIAPDRALPWLTVASGGLLAACGLGLLYRRVVLGRTGHSHLRLPGLRTHDHPEHEHDHGHDHAHPHGHDHAHDHDHDHGHGHGHEHGHSHDGHRQHHEPAPFRKAWLVLMGVAGGLVPTPSALVVLLGAIALHRTWFGVILVGLYGLGMAAALMGAGLLLVRLQGWLERHWYQRPAGRAAAPLPPHHHRRPARRRRPLHRPARLGPALIVALSASLRSAPTASLAMRRAAVAPADARSELARSGGARLLGGPGPPAGQRAHAAPLIS